MKKLVKVENARSGLSTCKKCQERIAAGEMRAGVDIWQVGRTATAWLHLECLQSGFKFAKCRGTGKCKFSGEKMIKGRSRLELAQEYTGIFYAVEQSAEALAALLAVWPMAPAQIEGFDTLEEAEKKVVLATWPKIAKAGGQGGKKTGAKEKRKRKSSDDDAEEQTPEEKQPKKATRTPAKKRTATKKRKS